MTPTNASEEARARQIAEEVRDGMLADCADLAQADFKESTLVFGTACAWKVLAAFAKPSPDTVSGEVERLLRAMNHEGCSCPCCLQAQVSVQEALAALPSPDALEG